MDWRRFFRRFGFMPFKVPPPESGLHEMIDAGGEGGAPFGAKADKQRDDLFGTVRSLPASSTGSLAIVLRNLSDSDPITRKRAVVEIGQLGKTAFSAADALIKCLADSDAGVRRTARIAILQVDPGADTIFRALGSVDAKIRESAAAALPRVAKLGEPPAQNVAKYLAADDVSVRQGAAQVLLDIGSPAVPALAESLQDSDRCETALSVLAKMGSVAAPTIGVLNEISRSHNQTLASEAIRTLGLIGPEALPVLIGLLQGPPNIRSIAIKAVAGMKTAAVTAIQPLMQLVHDQDRTIAVQAVAALREIGKEAAQPLFNMLDDPDLDALVEQPSEFEQGLPRLFGIISSRPPETVTGEICIALARLGSAEHLILALRNPRYQVRKAAAHALGLRYPGSKAAIPELVSTLADAEDDVRSAAIKALGYLLNDAEVRVDTLLKAIVAGRSRSIQASLLRIAAGEEELSILMRRLESEEASTRRAAAMAMRKMLPELATVRIPRLFGPEEDILSYESLTPDVLSNLATANPFQFAMLARYHTKTEFLLNFSDTSDSMGLEELIAEVQRRQKLLNEAKVRLQEEGDRQAETTPVQRAEARRYTDIAVFEGSQYPSDLSIARKLPDNEPLLSGSSYTVEVAIRLTRTGIDAGKAVPRGVANPRQDNEDLTIYVLATPRWEVIEIAEPLAKIKWPHDADSESALFRIKAGSLGASRESQGFIEVRIYDESLDLLDIVRVFATVVAPQLEPKLLRGIPARHLLWPEKHPGEPRFEPNSPQRLLTIHVNAIPKGYRFEFIFRDRGGEMIQVPFTRDIRSGDLTYLLTRVRDFWTELVITNYAAQLTVTPTKYSEYLSRLADIGTEAWSLLFGTRYADQKGTSEVLGDLLLAEDEREGARIQITYGDACTDFIFPWNILFAPKEGAPVDALRFWGARFQIEQVNAGPKRDSLGDEPVNVLFALDQSFGNSKKQIELFERYRDVGTGRVRIGDPISSQETLFDELTRDPSAHLIYFYCHGYASSGPGILRPDGVQNLRRQIEALEPDSKERVVLDSLLALTAKMGDESWIYVGSSEIKESLLKRQRFFASRRPIVFLNMCQSAALMPSMSSGLVRVFLDHNASAVVGTEAPMTAVFADEFGEFVLNSIFAGDDVGTSLWKARRRFLSDQYRNPLGLAYTLYGRATAHLCEVPLVASKGSLDSKTA